MGVKSILLKVLIGSIITAFLIGVIYFLSRPQEEPKEESITVFTSNPDEIRRIEIKEEESFALVNRGGEWAMEGMEDIALVSNLAETLAESLANITSPLLAEQKSSDLGKFGLEEPRAEIKLVFGDDEQTFFVGDKSGDYYYFRSASSEDVYVVSYDTVYLALSGKMSFLSKTFYTADAEDILKISYRDVVLEREGDGWREKSPYDMPADKNSVESVVLEPVTSIAAAEILTEAKMPKNDTTIEITSGDGEDRIKVSEAQDGFRYLTRENSRYIYKVSESSLSFLDTGGFDILSLYVAPIDIQNAERIEFSSPEGECVLSIEAPASEAPVFYKDGKEADETNFRDFYQTLVSLQFKGEGKAQGSAEYTVTFFKTDGEVYNIEFVPFSDSDYAVRLDGKSGFTVSKKSVTDLFGYLDNIKTV